MTASLSITLKNNRREIARIAELIETFGREHAIGADDVAGVNLALDEVLANIIGHAYDDRALHDIHVHLRIVNREIDVEVEDDGKPFNPLTWPPPDLDVPFEQRPVGGLGLHIARTVVDSMEYRRDGPRNVLTMRKRLSSA